MTAGKLITLLSNQLLDSTNETSAMLKTDKLAAVFHHAFYYPDLKSSLFVYIMTLISRSYGENITYVNNMSNVSNITTPLSNAKVATSVSSMVSNEIAFENTPLMDT